jgi:hypothetical protein
VLNIRLTAEPRQLAELRRRYSHLNYEHDLLRTRALILEHVEADPPVVRHDAAFAFKIRLAALWLRNSMYHGGRPAYHAFIINLDLPTRLSRAYGSFPCVRGQPHLLRRTLTFKVMWEPKVGMGAASFRVNRSPPP